MTTKKLLAGLFVLAASLNQISCKEAKDGEDGSMHLVKIENITNASCINGARRYTNYRDANRNGKFDAGEEVGTPIETCDDDPVGTLPPRDLNLVCDAEFRVDGQRTFQIDVGHHEIAQSRIQAIVPGFVDYSNEVVTKLEADKNLFVCEDNIRVPVPYIRVGSIGKAKISFDIVFLMDNSNSMTYNWAEMKKQLGVYVDELKKREVDYKVALIGYNENANITGAVNFSDGEAMLNFLKSYGGVVASGEQTHFEGQDRNGKDLGFFEAGMNTENAIPSIYYAQDHLSFRPDAQRIYINVTNEFLIDDTPPEPPKPADPDFVADSTKEYTPEKFCKDWNTAKGFIHTIWVGDVGTDTFQRSGTPVKDENGEYNLLPLDPADGKFKPTILTAPDCGAGIRQVQQVDFKGDDSFPPRPAQKDVPVLDFTKLLVTETLVDTSLVVFQTEDITKSHTLEIFIKDSQGNYSKGEFKGLYPEMDKSKF